jgi:hypothetical protein
MVLLLHNLHWLGHAPAQTDLCAHGEVTIQIGTQQLATPADGDWCVSAGAIYLFRTLMADHTDGHPVGEHLIPHCGHSMYSQTDSDDVLIMGCSNGVTWEVQHQHDHVLVRTAEGAEERLTAQHWQQTVLAFADAVAQFYAVSLPKVPADAYEAAGYAAFQAEWQRRRQAATLV